MYNFMVNVGEFRFMRISKSLFVYFNKNILLIIMIKHIFTHKWDNLIIYLNFGHSELFDLLALSGMLMDFNRAEILKRKQLFR